MKDKELRFDCVWYYVSSLKSAIDFYGELLGLTMVLIDYQTGWVEFHVHGSRTNIAFQEWGKTQESYGIKPDDHKSYFRQPRLVLSASDLERVAEYLDDHLVKHSGVQRISGVKYMNLYDFDGNLIQITQKNSMKNHA